MHIKKMISQNRRDFRALFACEHCSDEIEMAGYDDKHFHNHVIPSITCDSCGLKASSDYRPLSTKHPEGTQL